ncbi:hypothetical protein [Nocardia sp. NBC_00403]|uniref:hypothetical protein n=1 Tax=Nocardia sp. NBC_00403 TaxID=2975990 RepID=UPI002E216A1A
MPEAVSNTSTTVVTANTVTGDDRDGEMPFGRIIDAVQMVDVPVLINLGGSALTDDVQTAVAGYDQLLIRTNVDDSAHAAAPAVARSLLAYRARGS